jgi:phosphoribosyl 1,2-cyclic phosphate phosphodiesterase
MTKITATFLGTGTSQGIPVIACDCVACKSSDPKDDRLRTSLMISIGDKNIVIDTGPDFRQQMLVNKVEMIEAVLYTHEHKDHVAGMDDIRAFNFRSKKAMQIYASDEVQEALKREYHYVFMNKTYPGIPQVELNLLENEPLHFFGEKIIPINVWHHKLPVKAFRIRNFTYITDAKSVDELEFEKIKGTEILVVNALRREEHISHFNLTEALAFIEKVNPKKAYLTHISHLLGKQGEVSKELPKRVEIAYDGLQFDIA